MKRPSPEHIAEGVRAGDRTALGRALTLIESTHPDRMAEAQTLLRLLRDDTRTARRIGFTGPPGVGKSTLIDAWGEHLLKDGHRVAVLAVDPSSPKSGGSILGDKTRMQRLSMADGAFVRPSPSSGHLGGVTKTTRASISILEAAGFDTVIIETVGVGQSETLVHGMVDVFCVLLLPGAGDELQGIKKGIIEMADVLIVNKADGAQLDTANEAARQLAHAVHIITPSQAAWTPPVLTVSALKETGLDAISETLTAFQTQSEATGRWHARRQAQDVSYTRELINARATDRIWRLPSVKQAWPKLAEQVSQRTLRPEEAADTVESLANAPVEPEG